MFLRRIRRRGSISKLLVFLAMLRRMRTISSKLLPQIPPRTRVGSFFPRRSASRKIQTRLQPRRRVCAGAERRSRFRSGAWGAGSVIPEPGRNQQARSSTKVRPRISQIIDDCFTSQLVTVCPYIAIYTTDTFRVKLNSRAERVTNRKRRRVAQARQFPGVPRQRESYE